MIPTIDIFQPHTFVEGQVYLFIERHSNATPKIVQFHMYDSCPAFIIIRASDGGKIRCLRDDLFLFKANNQPSLAIQFSSLFRRYKGWVESEQLIS